MPAYHVVTPQGKVHKAKRQEVRVLRWLPEKVHIALRRIAEAGRKGLLAPSIQVALAGVQETMENDVAEGVEPKGKHRADRQAYRHGHEEGWAVIGGRKVRLQRPQVGLVANIVLSEASIDNWSVPGLPSDIQFALPNVND